MHHTTTKGLQMIKASSRLTSLLYPRGGGRRVRLDVVKGSCALVLTFAAAMILGASPALAAAPETPETGKANPASVTATTATLEDGVLNPHATGEVGEYEYRFRVSETECEGESSTTPEAALGNEKEAVPPVELMNLQPNAHYTFCLVEHNLGGEYSLPSPLAHFTTLPAAPDINPGTESASSVNAREATLNAEVNPNNQGTTYVFEYSTEATGETLEGTITKVSGGGTLAGFPGQAASVSTGPVLTQGKTYFYRVVVENQQSKKEGKPVDGTVQSFTTAIPVETPEAKPASPIAATTATLNGVLNPKSKRESEPGSDEFRYRQSATECQGENEKAVTPTEVLAGDEGEAVKAEVTELLPNTQYTFCLRATNNAGEESLSAPETFTTLTEPPAISEESVLQVSSTSATFQAKIDPEDLDTKYRFEYDTRAYAGSETHGERIPSPEGDVGAGAQGVSVEANPQDLKAATVYHFRVVAESPAGTTYGKDQTLTTQVEPADEGPLLPDGRAWEMVSPSDKNGSRIEPIGDFAVQASAEGNAITYDADAPITSDAPASTQLDTQILSERGPSGWVSQDISPPSEEAVEAPGRPQYELFSPDLSLAVVEPFGDTPLAPGVSASVKAAYLRENATGAYLPFAEISKEAEESLQLGMVTSTPDLSHMIVRTSTGFMLWSAGKMQPLGCRQPEFAVKAPSRHPISIEGSRIVCGDEDTGGHIYLHDMAGGETIQLDVPDGGSGNEPGPRFQVASSDDSRIFFSDSEPLLTANARPGNANESKGALYEFKLTSGPGEKLAGELTDLAIPLNGGEEGGLYEAVLGASEDGSYVYFVAKGELVPGATPGGLNLYVRHNETTTLIATLSAQDFPASPFTGTIPNLKQAVSPDGRYLTFMSREGLTGYDNRDVTSGEPDEEVYLYDGATGKLVCASCDPSGARPLGLHVTPTVREGSTALVDRRQFWNGRWLAAVLPGWDGLTEREAFYQPRYLFDEGRLFFDSSDALVPRATNGEMNVYEYEPQGVGSCERSSATFSAKSGGCVGLISSGTSGDESAFLDASENGDDVFFLSAGKLTSENVEGLNIYDAHVCSEAVPCPAAVAAPPPCATADSCRAAPSPQPEVFGASGSATFSGAGNLAPVTPAVVKKVTKKTVRCKKGFTKKKNKCVRNKGKKRAKRASRNRRGK